MEKGSHEDLFVGQADGDPSQQALHGVIRHCGTPGFAQDALAHLCLLTGSSSWAAYSVRRSDAPVLHLSASHGICDTTKDCFGIYRQERLYVNDTSFDAVRTASNDGRPLLLSMSAAEAPSADHRDFIYLRHGMVERLTVARREADDSLLAINLYHHTPQGQFTESQFDRFAAIAATLIETVARHIQWVVDTGIATGRAFLRRRCQALTPRELDVLERLLKGWTYDGIADDLGISVASVKTYRARAFERLNIHYRNQLFACVMQGQATGP